MVKKPTDLSASKLYKRMPALFEVVVDGGGTGWLIGDHFEAATLRRHLVAIHVCQDSEDGPEFSKISSVMEKTNYQSSSNSQKTFYQKVIKRVAEQSKRAKTVILEFHPSHPFGYYVDQLSAISILLTLCKGNAIFKRQSVGQFRGLLQSELSAFKDNFNDKTSTRTSNVKFPEKKALLGSISIIRRQIPESNLGWPLRKKNSPLVQEALRSSEARSLSVVEWVMGLPNRSGSSEKLESSFKHEPEGIERISNDNPEDCQLGIHEVEHNPEMAFSISFIVEELHQEETGWPQLRHTAFSLSSNSLQESKGISREEMESEMNLSSQSTNTTRLSCISSISREVNIENGVSISRLVNRSVCKWFSYGELKMATSGFSSESLIGEGGCSRVYRGSLPRSNSIVVKVLKPYKEARTDFLSEINVISSIKHKCITPLIGVCMENEHLISVYDYFPNGSLEENLHGNKGRCKFDWKMRFEAAVAVAEALNYLHNECSPPIIHRDVKSSNILLSEKFQPQLSDFGLAVWGPMDSLYLIYTDVVGTFGYLAPEYLMHGTVSDKIDVYSFGIILLELLSGRRPIDFSAIRAQESLALWAKEVLNSGNPKALLDPKMDIDFDDFQVQRMILAATLCINPSSRLRPNVSKILQLLKGEKDVKDFESFNTVNPNDVEDQSVDDFFLKFNSKPSLSLALRDIDHDDTTSVSVSKIMPKNAPEKSRRLKLKDYLKEQQE